MRIGEAVRKLDDGVIMRGAFYLLLGLSVIFLVTDIRDIASAENTELPGYDPLHQDLPVLPPALTTGAPSAPPVQPSTPAEVLRKPMTFELASGGVMKAEGAIEPGAAERFAKE